MWEKSHQKDGLSQNKVDVYVTLTLMVLSLFKYSFHFISFLFVPLMVRFKSISNLKEVDLDLKIEYFITCILSNSQQGANIIQIV